MSQKTIKKQSADCGPPTNFNDNTPGPQLAPTMCSGGNRVVGATARIDFLPEEINFQVAKALGGGIGPDSLEIAPHL